MNTTPQKLTFDGSIYREHLILYMDILGYSDLMLYGEEKKKQGVLEIQKQLLDFDKSGFYHQDGEKVTPQPLTTLLSDTFVCSYPMDDLRQVARDFGIKAALIEFQRHSVHVHNLFMKRGMLIRGAVVIGKIVNHNGMAYGEGLAIARKLESGKPPFIYYDPAVMELMQIIGTSAIPFRLNECIFNCSESGATCYDWLKHGFLCAMWNTRRMPQFLDLLEKQIRTINENLSATKNNPRAHEKWLAVAKHVDGTIKEHNTLYSSPHSSEPDWLYHGEPIRFP